MIRTNFATAAILAAGLVLVGAKPANERVIHGEGIVTGHLNGVAFRLRIEPGAVAMPIVDERVARAAGLKPGFMDWEYQIGPEKAVGRSAVAMIDTGTGPDKRRVAWSGRKYAAGIDGVIGPGLLDHDTVRFQLRPARAGEQVSSFPLVGQGDLDGRWGSRFAEVRLGKRKLKVLFDPHSPRTLATAQAGALIAATHDGRLEGTPKNTLIGFGIARPVRTMRLGRPLALGALAVAEMGVRTRDFGSSASIPDASDDPNEIVVTAGGKIKSKYDQLQVGADVLSRCSSITYALKAKVVRLSCL